MASKTLSSEKQYVCEYCNTGFTKEKTLISHLCESKRRHLQKNEKRVQLGFYAFQRFYKISAGAKTDKTYEEFAKSSFYNAFVKFGSYLNNVKPLYTEKYVDWIIKSNIKIDNWCKDENYEKYVIELILKEDALTALERSVKTMEEWAVENKSVWNHYFKYVSPNRAVWHIKDGKISPWLVLNSDSGKEMLSKFSDEQLNMIYHVLDPKHWSIKFKRHTTDIELIKEIVKEGNL